MTSTDSIHEIEAARKRLAAAKTQASAAAANLTSVKEIIAKMLDSAQALCDTANDEVKEAEKFLAETEKRLEVIDIDQETDSSPTKEGNKKRKAVSLSPQPNSNNQISFSVLSFTFDHLIFGIGCTPSIYDDTCHPSLGGIQGSSLLNAS